MAQVGKNFFEAIPRSNREDGEVTPDLQPVFQNEKGVFSKDNADYVKNLKKQIDMLDKLKKQDDE